MNSMYLISALDIILIKSYDHFKIGLQNGSFFYNIDK